MMANLDVQRLKTLREVRACLASSSQGQFTLTARKDTYGGNETGLRQLGYTRLDKADEGTAVVYVKNVVGFSQTQVTRLITQYRCPGRIRYRRVLSADSYERRRLSVATGRAEDSNYTVPFPRFCLSAVAI